MQGHRICSSLLGEKHGIRIIGDLVDSTGVVLRPICIYMLEYCRVKKWWVLLLKNTRGLVNCY